MGRWTETLITIYTCLIENAKNEKGHNYSTPDNGVYPYGGL
jgi:hypothetical protein